MTVPVVRLRPIEPDDLDVIFANQQDPVAAAMVPFPMRDREAFDAHRERVDADPTTVTRAIVVGDVVVGDIGSWVADGEREVGYWIGREHWGRGYATEALRLLVADVTERPIRAHVAVTNIGSQRVVERCGFVRVGEVEAGDGVREVIYQLD